MWDSLDGPELLPGDPAALSARGRAAGPRDLLSSRIWREQFLVALVMTIRDFFKSLTHEQFSRCPTASKPPKFPTAGRC